MADRNIRMAKVVKTSNDQGPYKLVTVQSDGKEMEAIVFESHGFSSSPHEEGQVLLLLPDGDEGKAVAFCMPRPKDRFDQQKPDEVTLKNHKTQTTLRLLDNGDLEIRSSGNVHINPV